MAFGASTSSWISVSSKTSGTTLTGSPTATWAVGDFVVLAISLDNTSTSDGNTSEVSSVGDNAGGNTWVKLREFCNSRGASNGGVTTSIWGCVLATAIGTGTTVTVTLANSKTAKAMVGWHFTMAAGSTISVAGSQDIATTAGTPTGLSISGLASQEYLFIAATGREDPGIGGDFTSYTGLTAGTTGGSSVTNIALKNHFRILTGTGDTPSPSGFPTADYSTVFLAIKEVAAGTALAGKLRL